MERIMLSHGFNNLYCIAECCALTHLQGSACPALAAYCRKGLQHLNHSLAFSRDCVQLAASLATAAYFISRGFEAHGLTLNASCSGALAHYVWACKWQCCRCALICASCVKSV